jgi:hypothetical protein
VLAGSDWDAVRGLIFGEALVGGFYIVMGYAMFLMIEKRSTRSGTLDAY